MTFPKLINNPYREAHEAHSPSEDAPHPSDGGRYLTDGVNLYRAVGTFGETAATGLVGLEDCRSLDVILFAPEHLSRLRTVEPAAR
jgi:hypothetical protein